MASPLSLLIALRFSRGRRRGGMVSLISVISTIGIALGVAVLIVGLSAMNGFERELNNRVLAVVPHGEIEPVNQPWNNWQEALAKVQKVKGIVAAAPYINFTGLVESGSNMRAIQVKGVDPQQESQLSALPTFVQNNAWAGFKAGEQQVILGKASRVWSGAAADKLCLLLASLFEVGRHLVAVGPGDHRVDLRRLLHPRPTCSDFTACSKPLTRVSNSGASM